ncbi:DUF1254 domain-containing protein [Sandaracinobacter neustonicus]|uniref:DUF1254 domain-containing protein n=1 Tax=Sandaracinobacter neustonicus TaxID=1715348 RepID=A0A501XGA7_9SPHN|nr:DUF1214 domain-containing protein [Sandaracinobacter neustonicus]TPE59495.1 DUF1254 domain-containing protein [Sandaracinobacter neustonicus]
MKKLLIVLLLVAALLGAGWMWLRTPIAETSEAALAAFPVYSIVRARNEQLLRIAHRGENGSNLLIHRSTLSGPRDRTITTPNNDTLYSTAFLDLSAGPVLLTIPKLNGRYASAVVMDSRTDNVILLRETDEGRHEIAFGNGKTGTIPGVDGAPPRHLVPSKEGWLLIRTLVDGPADLEAARAAQAGFTLEVPEASRRPQREAVVLPVLPDPAMLLRRANPVIAENPYLARPALAATGYGQGGEAFEALPVWRQWLWRFILPRAFDKLKAGLNAGARSTDDGWSNPPPGIGTASATDAVRSAVALGGLAALPKEEATYWMAVLDSDRQDFDGAHHYRLTIPANVPVGAFWSLSLYERLPDGRLFFVENPIQRYAVGDRTQGLKRNADGSLTITIQPTDPGPEANWLPSPASGPFNLAFRAYRPGEPIRNGSWRLPPVERVEQAKPPGQ